MEEGWFEFWCLLGPVPRMDFITRHGDKKINLTRGGSKEADKILAIARKYYEEEECNKEVIGG